MQTNLFKTGYIHYSKKSSGFFGNNKKVIYIPTPLKPQRHFALFLKAESMIQISPIDING